MTAVGGSSCADGGADGGSTSPSSTGCISGEYESGIQFQGFDPSLDLPRELPDPVFFGEETKTSLRCYHGEIPLRKVAFDMAATGRRFLGCPKQERCPFVVWIDDSWDPVLTRAMLKLWNYRVRGSALSSVLDCEMDEMDRAYLDLWNEKARIQSERDKLIADLKSSFRTVGHSRSEEFWVRVSVSAISVSITLLAFVVLSVMKKWE